MGRPLNDRNFGDGKILVRINGDATAVIIKQTGSKTFMCAADYASRANAVECKLVSKLAPAAGECSIVLDAGLSDAASLFVTKISGRKLTASNGEFYTWSLDGDESDSTGDHFDLTDE